MTRHRKTLLTLAAAAVPPGVLRYFMKGWVEPLGVPTVLGSFFASLTFLLLVGLVVLFTREGRFADGRYLRAVAAYALPAAWCEVLVIGDVLVTARTGADTDYEGPWEAVRHTFPDPAAHALGHARGFLPRLLSRSLSLPGGLARRQRLAGPLPGRLAGMFCSGTCSSHPPAKVTR